MQNPLEKLDFSKPSILNGDAAPTGDMLPNGERVPDGERAPDGERLPDGDRSPDVDGSRIPRPGGKSKLLASLVYGNLSAARVTNAKEENGDLMVDVVIETRNFSSSIFPTEQIARARAYIAAKAGYPIITGLREIPSEGLQRITRIQNVEKIDEKRTPLNVFGGDKIPNSIKQADYKYEIKVVGKELGPYMGDEV